ncbi:MAG: metallophosphoesterase [Candidatus Berkelbacteria bacterium]|nr:metallophosphoesterase [Candidatus Berkelbacteria bacterium]
MKAFLFADLHANFKQLDNFKKYLVGNDGVDLIISAGDIVNMGEPVGFMEQFILAVDKIGKPFFWVPGNNDFGRAYFRLKAKYPSLEGGITVIPAEAGVQASGADPRVKPEDDTIRLTGVGGSPASWAGQYAGENMIMSKKIADSIFVSHVPPPGVFNYLKEDNHSPTAKKLSDSPLAHICGHIHQQWGIAYLGKTKIVKLAPLERGFYAIMDLDNLAVEFRRFDGR